MGVRRRLKQELRRGLQRGQSRWMQALAPFRARKERDQLAAINALLRVQETQLPEGLGRDGGQLVLFSHYHPRGWLQRCIRPN